MAKRHGKRYNALAEKIERGREYPPTEAAKLINDTSQAKFDTTVELHLRMGVDPKHADQMVRGAAVLPNGTGKKVRVIAFAQGDKAREADRRRLARLRRRGRNARPDGSGGTSWPRARSAWPHAEPEVRDRDLRC